MDLIFSSLLSFLISAAANVATDAINDIYELFQKTIKQNPGGLDKIQSRKTLMEQLELVGVEIARNKVASGIPKVEQHLFDLLLDPIFQGEIASWFLTFRPVEKKKAELELSQRMEAALKLGGADDKSVEHFKKEYFQYIETQVFQNHVLAAWRLSLQLNEAFERMDELESIIHKEGKKTRSKIRIELETLRQEIRDMATRRVNLETTHFTEEQRRRAVDHYCELALESCDIIDLANMPEGDRYIAGVKKELRHLYVPLRVQVEVSADHELKEIELEKIEKQRDVIRFLGFSDNKKKNCSPLGKRISEAGRLVILGDPGGGKTTLMRWIATAYLLRRKKDNAFNDIPDVKSLPDRNWLPILIRCRDLGESCATAYLDDVLCNVFRSSQLSPEETTVLQVVMREMLSIGEAILLVDGLDEIPDTQLRTRFCRQIESIHIAFPKAPMIVTSRIVGYRDMGYRIGRGFEHATVAEFSKDDKDEFAKRWCAIVERPERREKVTIELIKDIHSTDRIERLTGNPMLLTTMALVKRNVGRLPKNRADLYWEAVLVLLKWRSEVDDPMDRDETLPQLEYIAFDMCLKGVQQLRKDEILDLLERIREEFPNKRAIRRNEPAEFLSKVERRTGILVESGMVRHNGMTVPVYEFKHLTFQEYLAARALLDKTYPGRDKTKSLTLIIAPLAGHIEKIQNLFVREDAVVKERWREVLRLFVACCQTDDVDEALRAILTPMDGENAEITTRPRAILATLCLADEPDTSEEMALEILQTFVRNIENHDGGGNNSTLADSAAIELVGTEWEHKLRLLLINEFLIRKPDNRSIVGGLASTMAESHFPSDKNKCDIYQKNLVSLFNPDNEKASIEIALIFMSLAFRKRIKIFPGMIDGLMAMLDKSAPSVHAAAWALFWISKNGYWIPSLIESERLITLVNSLCSEIETVRWIILILGKSKNKNIINTLIDRLHNSNKRLRIALIEALVQLCIDDEIDRKLLSIHFDEEFIWIDPLVPIEEKRVKDAAKKLNIPIIKVRQRYEKISTRFHNKLKLSWVTD